MCMMMTTTMSLFSFSSEITRDSPDEFDQYTDEDYLPRRGDHYGRGGGMRRPQRQGMGKENSRIFVALFDYDPPTMSPNPEACDDELDFREGQLIKVGAQTCQSFDRIQMNVSFFGRLSVKRMLMAFTWANVRANVVTFLVTWCQKCRSMMIDSCMILI